jgi:inner membrane protein
VDNLTHTLVGAALGEAGLKRRTGLGMATLMIAANLPDIDVLAIPFGHGLTFRRGWTHGPIALIVLPVLLTLAVVAWDRWQDRRGTRPPSRLPVRAWQVLLLAVVGVLSHPFFDWLNTYGIRLLMPFSHEWFYGDAVFIIDPWIWLALGLGVYFSRRRRRAAAPLSSRPARVVLGAVAVYIAMMIAGSRSAERLALREIQAQQQGPVYGLMAGPVPLNPLRRQLIYDTGEAYVFGSVAWTPRPEVSFEDDTLPKQHRHPAVQSALHHPTIQNFLYWSRFPVFAVDDHAGNFVVHAGDVRFARDARDGWMSESVPVPREHVRR